MAFRPKVNSEIIINGKRLFFCEHPNAPGMPYGQSGKRALVYQVRAPRDVFYALKVFNASFRKADIEESARILSSYAGLPGLQVCKREVLQSTNNPELIQAFPDLNYAVLMPWVMGMTWYDVLNSRQAFTKSQSVNVARAFLAILSDMETRGLAHCDLSGPNVIINNFVQEGFPQVSLVDVEEMFGPGFKQPSVLPGGTSGYGHSTSRQGQWNAAADRFAGAVLVCEMLAWCDPEVRGAAEKEQFFAASEMQTDCDRAHLLYASLQKHWGSDVARLFQKAWESRSLSDCPSFAEWQQAVSQGERHAVATFRPLGVASAGQSPAVTPVPVGPTTTNRPLVVGDLDSLTQQAQHFEASHDYQSALDMYKILARKSNDPALRNKIAELEARLAARTPVVPGPDFSNPAQPGAPVARPSPYPHLPVQGAGAGADKPPAKPANRWPIWLGIGVLVLGICLAAAVFSGAFASGLFPSPATEAAVYPTDVPPTEVILPVEVLPAAAVPTDSPVPTATREPSQTPVPVPGTQYVRVIADRGVELRKGPNIGHPLANPFPYPPGAEFEVLGYYGQWYFVKADDGTLGWTYYEWVDTSSLLKQYLEEISNAPTLPPPTPEPRPTKKNRYP